MYPMQFIDTKDQDIGVHDMAGRILEVLHSGNKVLWLICGGSNIPFAVEAMESIRESATREELANLTIGQTDERYGALGHMDSNWAQLKDSGMNFTGVQTVPILVGKALEATVTDYADRLKPVMNEVSNGGGLILAQFGIGPDGHIAGMFPNTSSVNDPRLVSSSKGGDFVRITITAAGLLKVDEAFVFAFGEPKKKALENLRDKDMSLEEEPCSILKNITKVFIYTDVFL